MAEAVRELFGSSFYLAKDTFDGVPISVSDVSKSGVVSMESSEEPRTAIDEERGVVDLMLLAGIVEKHPGGDGGSRRERPDVKGVIGSWIDSVDESEALVRQPEVGDFW